MRSDAELQRGVLEELRLEPAVNAVQIGVTAHNGVVTLSGTVATYPEKSVAEETTRHVYGVALADPNGRR